MSGELRDQLVTLLAAGHETTAGALAWALERLARHPAVLEQLRAGEPGYADAVVKEVLRTHPGTTEVRLRLVTRGGTRVLRLDDRLRVAASPALYGDLKHLLGPGCLG